MPNPDEKDIVDETAAVVERLCALSNLEHDDLSIGDEAADLLERLSRERGTVPEEWQLVPKEPTDADSIHCEAVYRALRGAMRANHKRRRAVNAPGGQWHDISTAPKDGSKILAWDGDYVIVKANPDGGWSDDFQQYLRLDKWMPLPPRPGDRTDSGEAQSISLNQTSIPEGYVLVPREPDADMAEVARDWAQRDWNAFGDPKGYLKFYQGIYRAMINAVPKPEGE